MHKVFSVYIASDHQTRLLALERNALIPVILFVLSIAVQLAAAIYALLLIRVTGRKLAWIFISGAMVLMTWRRIASFISILTAGKEMSFQMPELIAAVSSCLMLLGVLRIGEYFRSIKLAESKRNQAEEIISINELMSKSIINSLPGIFCMFDENGRFLQWNNNFEIVGGYSTEEMKQANPVDFFISEEKELVAQCIQEVFVKGSANVEAHFVTKTGQTPLYYLTGRRITLSDIPYVVGVGIDITERKKTEEALKQSEANLRRLIGRIPVAMAVADNNNKFMFFNNKFMATFGYTLQDIPTVDHWWPLAYPDAEYRHKVMNNWREAATKAIRGRTETEPREWQVTCKDGSLRDIEFRMASMRDMNVVIYHDVTERKKAEAEKRKLEGQLLQAQKMDSIGQLAGGIAHDFNNLLTSIIGYSDLMLTELPESDVMKNKIRTIRDAGTRAADLVRQLLAFSRRQMLEMKPVNLNEIIRNMNKIFGRTIGEDIELDLDIVKPIKNVLADTGQLEQILMNLVVNASDAMPNGGRLIIETDSVYLDETYALMHSQLVTPGPYVMLSVADNGIGMSHEIKEKIFEPFFTTKENGRGTGLGLSTTYGIIKQHNGYIWVYSEPGKGTTFKVYFPAIEEEAKEMKKDEPSITGEGTETILVVDDEPLVRQFVIDVLQPRGYKVFEAGNAEEAFKIAEEVEGKIDLLLTDMIMPGIKGGELRKLFIERWPRIKVCLMSGYGDKEIIGGRMEDIMFIMKPLTPRKLTTKLREVLD